MGVKMVQRLLLVLFISSLISASCASHKKAVAQQSTVEVQPPPTILKDTVVPVKNAEKEEIQRTPYTVRLLLPLRLEEHFANDTLPDQPLIYDNTLSALHFYLGAMAAVDSLKNLPVDLHVEVVDVSGDSIALVNKLKQKAFKNADLALSFLPAQFLDVAIAASAAANCQLVIQGGSNTQLAAKYPNIWLASPANSTQLGMMSEYLFKENPNTDFLVFTRKQRSENVLANFIASRLDSLAGKKVCKLIEYNKDTWETTQKSFPKNKRIHVIIPTQDESYLQAILNKFKAMDPEYLFHLIGLPSWENFESVDPALLAEYQTTIFNGLHIDVDHPVAKKFRKAFIDLNHADAQPQAYQAYDLLTYFVSNYAEHGKNYSSYQAKTTFELPAKGLQFSPVCNGCGYENSSLNILRYWDFRLSRVAEFQR
jgi:hypothetical protein